jgi:hypothetical protein
VATRSNLNQSRGKTHPSTDRSEPFTRSKALERFRQGRSFRNGKQSLEVKDRHPLPFQRDKLVMAQAAKRPIDVDRSKAERVANELLGQRCMKGQAYREPGPLQAYEQFKEKMAQAFVGRPPTAIDDVLTQSR